MRSYPLVDDDTFRPRVMLSQVIARIDERVMWRCRGSGMANQS